MTVRNITRNDYRKALGTPNLLNQEVRSRLASCTTIICFM